jgi:hypothetical protein
VGVKLNVECKYKIWAANVLIYFEKVIYCMSRRGEKLESEIADHPFLMTSFTPYGWTVCFWGLIIALQVAFPSNLYRYTNHLGAW